MSYRSAIEATFTNVVSALFKRAYERFNPRMEAVVAAEGGFID